MARPIGFEVNHGSGRFEPRTNRSPGPRRLDPSSDLTPVASLIEEAFSDELDREGREVLHELRRLGHLGPLLWLLRQASPDFGEVLSGFVWEDDGQIVGNTSLNLTGPFPAQWRISNVAVLPSHRRRGIARCLLEEAIEYVRVRGGRAVSLQVRDDNVGALELYRSLGFTVVTAETELVAPRLRQCSKAPGVPQTVSSPPVQSSLRKDPTCIRWSCGPHPRRISGLPLSRRSISNSIGSRRWRTPGRRFSSGAVPIAWWSMAAPVWPAICRRRLRHGQAARTG